MTLAAVRKICWAHRITQRLAKFKVKGGIQMRQRSTRTAFLILLTSVLILAAAQSSRAQASLTTKTGTLSDGATYLIEVPSDWNGTLFLYSHGYVMPGSPNPATDVGDPATRAFMLANGFALAGSSYATTGWAIHEALTDQIAVLDVFDSIFGHPASHHRLGTFARRHHYGRLDSKKSEALYRRATDVRSVGRRSRHLEYRA